MSQRFNSAACSVIEMRSIAGGCCRVLSLPWATLTPKGSSLVPLYQPCPHRAYPTRVKCGRVKTTDSALCTNTTSCHHQPHSGWCDELEATAGDGWTGRCSHLALWWDHASCALPAHPPHRVNHRPPSTSPMRQGGWGTCKHKHINAWEAG